MTKKLLVITIWLLFSVMNIANSNETLPSLEDVASADLSYTIASFEHDKKMLESQIKYRGLQIQHYQELVDINETAYRTQQVTTNIMTGFVMVIVFFGLVLSYWQFKNDVSGNGKNNGDEKAAFKVSKEGVEFRSSVIGLVILFMSFFFFYLYVKEIYKIEQHNVQTAPANIISTAISGEENSAR
ncbi:hypothetical protein ABXY91_004074 [Vibrio fluvialis]